VEWQKGGGLPTEHGACIACQVKLLVWQVEEGHCVVNMSTEEWGLEKDRELVEECFGTTEPGPGGLQELSRKRPLYAEDYC